MTSVFAQMSRTPTSGKGLVCEPPRRILPRSPEDQKLLPVLEPQKPTEGRAGKIKLPLLILQGTGDRLVNPDGAQDLYDSVGSQDKTIKMYEKLYHEVFNEPEREQVLADVEGWLNRQMKIIGNLR